MFDLDFYKGLNYERLVYPVNDREGNLKFWKGEVRELKGLKVFGETMSEVESDLDDTFDFYIRTMLEQDIAIPLPKSKDNKVKVTLKTNMTPGVLRLSDAPVGHMVSFTVCSLL